ncbi:hypothetical protein NQ315_000318 [Exocentrus adspersus]|uniref:Uncharacterized protein n=1 Tax=Exocentrus adspersus TaxID=1586481 RepID=A0AAV8VQZ2_9CUCU|nr:hypothetical protein NQ315_000318 [Exocentrus adspersus]
MQENIMINHRDWEQFLQEEEEEEYKKRPFAILLSNNSLRGQMYRSGEMERPKERGRHRLRVENEMIRRREKESAREETWGGAERYYRHWEKANAKFDEWTSPRYYQDNNKLLAEIRRKRDKEELLEKRKEKLRRLLEEEQRSYEIELMVYKNKSLVSQRSDDVPLEVLREVNDAAKAVEEERRRREAETKLYHQWRKNNPIIRQYESKYRCKDIKLTWLDQQIEKRMQKEREEEEAKRILKERDERLKKEKEKEELYKKRTRRQKGEAKNRLGAADTTTETETGTQRRTKLQLDEIEEKQREEERRRRERECALYNLKQHKLKLKRKAADIQESLLQEQDTITKLKALQLEDLLQDEAVYDKQKEVWKREELSRQQLLKDVLDTIRDQVEQNLEKNREKQKQLLLEREEMAKRIDDYNKELEKLREEEMNRKVVTKKMLDDDIKVKNARKKQQENMKLREIDEELERIRREEERLQKEILRIQQRQGPFHAGAGDLIEIFRRQRPIGGRHVSEVLRGADRSEDCERQLPEWAWTRIRTFPKCLTTFVHAQRRKIIFFSGFNKEEASEAKQRFDILNRIIQIETSSLKNLRERDSNNNAEEFVGFPPGDLHDSLVDYKKLYRFSKLKIFKPISFDTRSSYFPEKIPGTCTCTPFKPDLDYESEYFKRINLKNYSSTRFTPPRSPHNLIEEVLHHDPWALLVATIFLNRTSCFCARPYVFWFLVENPDPLKVLAKCPRDLEKYFVNLGLQRTRAAQVWRMSRDFVHKHWRSVRELYGIGGYGETAFRMFCQGDFSVEPRDRFLRIYKAWYLKIATKRPPRTYE